MTNIAMIQMLYPLMHFFFVEWDMWQKRFDKNFPENGNLICFDLGLSPWNENKQWEF